jgi:hypothetical protein
MVAIAATLLALLVLRRVPHKLAEEPVSARERVPFSPDLRRSGIPESREPGLTSRTHDVSLEKAPESP